MRRTEFKYLRVEFVQKAMLAIAKSNTNWIAKTVIELGRIALSIHINTFRHSVKRFLICQ